LVAIYLKTRKYALELHGTHPSTMPGESQINDNKENNSSEQHFQGLHTSTNSTTISSSSSHSNSRSALRALDPNMSTSSPNGSRSILASVDFDNSSTSSRRNSTLSQAPRITRSPTYYRPYPAVRSTGIEPTNSDTSHGNTPSSSTSLRAPLPSPSYTYDPPAYQSRERYQQITTIQERASVALENSYRFLSDKVNTIVEDQIATADQVRQHIYIQDDTKGLDMTSKANLDPDCDDKIHSILIESNRRLAGEKRTRKLMQEHIRSMENSLKFLKAIQRFADSI
jgi:hypothetical protein